jgi:hypothetical protein
MEDTMADVSWQLIKKISDLKKLYEPIKSINKGNSEVSRAFDAYARAQRTGLITGDNEAVIMADNIAQNYQKQLSPVANWDENQWIANSSYNALQRTTWATGIAELRAEKRGYEDLKDAFEGMARMLYALSITDNIDVKGWAKLFCPSLKAIDEIHRQDVIRRFNGLQTTVGHIVTRIDNVLKVLERTR